MPVPIPCRKCGNNIEVPDEDVRDALTTGKPLTPEHETCPTDKDVQPTDLRCFRLIVNVYEVDLPDIEKFNHSMLKVNGRPEPYSAQTNIDVLIGQNLAEKWASFGAIQSARSFEDAIEPLGKSLNENWNQVMELAPVIDADLKEGGSDTPG